MEKPLILLIPGLDGTGLMYARQIPALQERYRVLAWRHLASGPFGYPDLVRDLGEKTAAEPPGTVAVVGESFGGTVALHYALAFPERMRTLVLVNTFPEYRGRIKIRLACRLAPVLRWPVFRIIKDVVAELTLALEGIRVEERLHYRKMIRQVDPAAYQQRLHLIRDVRLRDRLPEIRVPTLIFAAGRDKIVASRREARYMSSRMAKARVFEFPRAGHALLLTRGFRLADYV